MYANLQNLLNFYKNYIHAKTINCLYPKIIHFLQKKINYSTTIISNQNKGFC